MNKEELNEKQLNNVAGGSDRKRQLSICIEIPEFLEDVIIKVYLDGELDTSKTKTVASSVKYVTYTFSGTGMRSLVIKFNDTKTINYVLNFYDYSYKQID